ncbi:hypothetical protein EB796_003270 [Bugula neritina]|uniref:Uncharacterized protein n=1 Tax=Bugula neritina TaxID=10212 RepID=A0A7J7KKK6_BUGNE|nr:hypothetical protein EB796_003270 [Bugula neritina]
MKYFVLVTLLLALVSARRRTTERRTTVQPQEDYGETSPDDCTEEGVLCSDLSKLPRRTFNSSDDEAAMLRAAETKFTNETDLRQSEEEYGALERGMANMAREFRSNQASLISSGKWETSCKKSCFFWYPKGIFHAGHWWHIVHWHFNHFHFYQFFHHCCSLVTCGGMVDVFHNIDMSDSSSGDGLGDSNGDGLN